MSERPPRPEVSAFLHDRATSLDREAAPVTADEAARRTIVDAGKPGRQWPAALRPAQMRTSPRSVFAAAAVVALVVGALGGFAVGRSSAPKHSTVATAAANAPKPESVDGSTTLPGLVANGSTGMAIASGVNQGSPMTRLFDRTTSDGIAIHAFKQDQGAPSFPPDVACAVTNVPNGVTTTVTAPAGTNQPSCPANAWSPPPECYGNSLLVEAGNQGAVGQTGSPGYPLHDVAAVTSPLRFGDAEGSPASGWIVNTSDQVAKVEARWTDGFVDSMAPTNGWAVVAHNGANFNATIVVFNNTGAALKTFTTGGSSYAQPPAECMPPPPAPPPLPPAGAEQPDDPSAARQGVTDAYQTVFTHGSDPTTNAALIEDPDSLKQTQETVRSNFPQALDTVTVTVGEMVFTSKTEAALYFELNYQGGALFGQQIGHAKLIDGTWKIAHDTMCMVLGWGGGQCDGGSGSSPGAPPATPLTTIPNN